MSKHSKYSEQVSPSQKGKANSQSKSKAAYSESKYDPNPSILRTTTKDISKPSHGQYYDFRLHIRDPKSVPTVRYNDFTDEATGSRQSSNNLLNQTVAENYAAGVQHADSAALIYHTKKRSQTEIPLEHIHSNNTEVFNSFDPYSGPKETSFSRLSYDLHETPQNFPPLHHLQFSTNQSEMAELMAILEQRFYKLEGRIEHNESFIRLQDEMQRLKTQEARSTVFQEGTQLNELNFRISALESKVRVLEEIIQTQRMDVESKLDEFVKRIEGYLERFVENTSQLAQKVESLHRESEDELKLRENRMVEVETKIDQLANEVRDKLKVMCDSVSDFAKMSENTANSLAIEKENFKNLEGDFLKLISSCKESNAAAEDYKWLADEISFLKYRYLQIMNMINPNQSRNLHQES